MTSAAWSLVRGADLGFPAVEGPRTTATRVLGRYLDRVQAGAERDPHLGRAFLRVAGLMDPPAALLRPSVLARAYRPVG